METNANAEALRKWLEHETGGKVEEPPDFTTDSHHFRVFFPGDRTIRSHEWERRRWPAARLAG